MQGSSEQSLVGEEHCVTTLITAAKETIRSEAANGVDKTRIGSSDRIIGWDQRMGSSDRIIGEKKGN